MNQQIGTYDYIDRNFVLAGAKSQLGLRETTSEDAYLIDAINDGVKNLRIFGTFIPIVTQLEIDHEGSTPKALLPTGFSKFFKKDPIVFVNSQGNAVAGVSNYVQSVVVAGSLVSITTSPATPIGIAPNSQPVFANSTFFENNPYGDAFSGGGTVSLVDGTLYFSSNVDAEFVKISFLGTNFEDGEIKIPATAELAVRFYACEQWSGTQFAITGEQKYRVMQQDFSVKWAKNKAKAKVIGVMPDTLEYESINRTYKSLI